MTTAEPAQFREAVEAMNATTVRPEIELGPIRPPQRLAPFSYALGAEVRHPDTAIVPERSEGDAFGRAAARFEQMGVGPFERLFQTADGWVCVVALTDTERTTLLRTLGATRFDDENEQAEAIASAVVDRKSAEVVADLVSAGLAAAEPVGRNVHAFMNDLEQRRLNRVAEVAHPLKGNVRELYALVRISDAELVPHRLAPELGENTDDVLSMVGYTAAEVAELRARKAVR